MLLPAQQALTCYIGGTWDQEFDFWDDAAETIPHDFTGWVVSFVITHQDGSTTPAAVQVTANAVVASLDAATTGSFTEQAARYVLRMHDATAPNNVEFLMRGDFRVTVP